MYPAFWPQWTWAKIWGWGANTTWAKAYLHDSFMLIRPTVWPQYTNVTDRTGQTDRQTERETGQTTVR